MNTEHLSDTHLANELLKILKEAFKNYENPIENYWRTAAVLVMFLAGISERERHGSTAGWLFYFNNLVDGVLLPVQERKKTAIPTPMKKPLFWQRLFTSRKQ